MGGNLSNSARLRQSLDGAGIPGLLETKDLRVWNENCPPAILVPSMLLVLDFGRGWGTPFDGTRETATTSPERRTMLLTSESDYPVSWFRLPQDSRPSTAVLRQSVLRACREAARADGSFTDGCRAIAARCQQSRTSAHSRLLELEELGFLIWKDGRRFIQTLEQPPSLSLESPRMVKTEDVTCSCGVVFTKPTWSDKRYCSLPCAARFRVVAEKPKKPKPVKKRVPRIIHPCAECGADTTRRTYCSGRCYARRHAKSRAERHRELGIPHIPNSKRRRIYKRDDDICQLCGAYVDIDLAGTTEPMAPCLAHIVARSKGGSDDDDNLQTAHVLCNILQGVGTPDEFVARIIKCRPILEAWARKTGS